MLYFSLFHTYADASSPYITWLLTYVSLHLSAEFMLEFPTSQFLEREDHKFCSSDELFISF